MIILKANDKDHSR